jgi:hypothetical protein
MRGMKNYAPSAKAQKSPMIPSSAVIFVYTFFSWSTPPPPHKYNLHTMSSPIATQCHYYCFIFIKT